MRNHLLPGSTETTVYTQNNQPVDRGQEYI